MSRSRRWCLLLVLGLTGAARLDAAPPPRPTEPALRVELLRLSREDRLAHDTLLGRPGDKAAQSRVREVDRYNSERLKAIVARHGWPVRSMVGQDGEDAAWLLLQHADHDRDFQHRCLKLMEPLLQKDEIRKEDYAFLLDRVLVAEGKQQRYGTQFKLDGRRVEPYPIEDPEHVDERRKAMGLGPLAEYRRQLELLNAPEPPPAEKK